MSLKAQIAALTGGVADVQAKPELRYVLEAELLKLGNEQQEVGEALDELFKVTLQ